jgi:3-deoxy-7-phosphoheptulonate synthase
MAAKVEDLLLAAEYVLAAGNSQLILCERGIRTFETATRNTLDLAAVPLLKAKSHLPVLVDPSHATGIRELVIPMALAAAAAGADGVMVEVHIHPPSALSDGPQSLFPEQMLALGRQLDAMLGLLGRSL